MFRLSSGNEELVIRFGNYVDDFRKISLLLHTPRQICRFRKCSQSGKPLIDISLSPNELTESL